MVQCLDARTNVMNDTNDTITFKFDGANISTDALGGSLLPLAAQVYNLVQACSEEEARLVSIENNCVKMTFARTAAIALALCAPAPEGVKDVAKFNVSTRAINAMLANRGATLEVMDGSRGTVRKFAGDSELPSLPEVHHDVKATMAIYGELTDVGGLDPNVHVQSDAFPGGVVLKIERDDARKLAPRLYSQIGVNASVTIRDGKIASGKVLDVIDYEPEDMGEWLKKNGGALGVEAFEGVNLADFIAEQRI